MLVFLSDMKTREIEKNPMAPKLSGYAVQLLTELCFRRDDELTNADALIIFGTQHNVEGLVSEASKILTRRLVPAVIITGGTPTYSDSLKLEEPESSSILRKIEPDTFPDVIFHTESVSENTLENVKVSLSIPDFAAAQKVMFLFKSHACGRGYLTLRRYFHHAPIIQRSYSVTYKEGLPMIDRDNWWKTEFSVNRVWGEFLRIERCGSRGDIAYPADVSARVHEIRKET